MDDMNTAGGEEMVKCACGQEVKKSEWDAHAAMGAEHTPAPAEGGDMSNEEPAA